MVEQWVGLAQARCYSEVPADTLLLMAAQGENGARRERMIREVMLVHQVEWQEAEVQTDQMVTYIITDQMVAYIITDQIVYRRVVPI